tara:strand:- start:16481 stop:17008 length:528 start_codon:yes stop_codon:yes gene_type:complete
MIQTETKRSLFSHRIRGFTLIETIIVLVILVIIAAIVIPMQGSVHQARLEAAGRLVIADIEFARTRSLGTAADPCVVVFDVPTNSYRLALQSNPLVPITNPISGEPYERQFGKNEAAGMNGVVIESVNVIGGQLLEFNSAGLHDQLIDVEIEISYDDRSLVVLIDREIGRVTIAP